MDLDKLPINVFDCVVLATLVIGLLRGRKHGMSEELMGMVKWLAVVIVCAMVYEPAGQWFAKSSPFSLLASFLFIYTAGALLILSLFAFWFRLCLLNDRFDLGIDKYLERRVRTLFHQKKLERFADLWRSQPNALRITG